MMMDEIKPPKFDGDEFNRELVDAMLRLRRVFKKRSLEGPIAITLSESDFMAIKAMPAKDWLEGTQGRMMNSVVGVEIQIPDRNRSEREVIEACISQLRRMIR